MKKTVLLFSIALVFIFSGCSSKEVFKPTQVAGEWEKYGDKEHSIIDISSDVALLENRKVLTKESELDIEIEDGYRVLGKSDSWVISANTDGFLTLTSVDDANKNEKFELKKSIASASTKDDILAVLFADNEMALYNVSTKELLLKVQGSAPIIVDSRIVSPYFMNDLVLFLTLDGKIVITNTKLKKRLRTIIVSSQNHFNNVIYFDVVDNKLIAATGTKLFSMAEKEIRASHEIRNIAYDNKEIYITTKQGEVISLSTDLHVNAKTKFPFAHFLGMIITDEKIFLLEKEGYIIEMSKDLLEYSIYEVDLPEGYIFATKTMFYIDDEYISTQ